MRAQLIFIMVTIVTGVSAGCGGLGKADMEEETARLLQTDKDFAAASLEHGAAEAFRMYLHDDAIMFSRGRHAVRGSDSIYKIMSAGAGSYSLEWTPRAAEVAVSGELGWSWGEYTFTSTGGDGIESRSYGKYVNVWRKNTEGEWKVIADIGNESPPPGE